MHPALDTVLWKTDELECRIERASYRGHALMVRHTGDLEWRVSVGYVDGRFIGTGPNMPRICELLLVAVDRMEKA
jgi:hypothetical protein